MYPDEQVAKELFDEEVAGHKAELQLLNSAIAEQTSNSRNSNVNLLEAPTTTGDSTACADGTSLPSKPVNDCSPDPVHTPRRVSAKTKMVTADRRVSQLHHMAIHQNQDHLFSKLADKDHQLKTAKHELVAARELVQDMENELERLRRENAELVKLQGTTISQLRLYSV